ncbi:hypothetical protein KO481_02270 [Nocardia sp. NEAU-G5]|uniref:DUF8020 domain-containing protein n=1 Tax=Nocardia albiluteola TaxID=2842303 RepID=A0ABS6AS33_9NOCA|nr:hypothetical protein [Nocardia albiluteola]MBU3060346.1 hypothetical protein [Nocardia albiluteola]
MKFGKFAATALLAVATVGIAAGTANASPPTSTTPVPAPAKVISASGIDKGVAYHATLSDLNRKLTTVVQNGRFELAPGGGEVDLRSGTGTTLAKVPLSYKVDGSTVHLGQQISADGHQLVLAPKAGSAKEIGQLQPVSSMARLMNQINQNVVAMVIGGVLGGLIGAVVGLFFLSWLTGPIGLLVGALAGGAIMGGAPFTNALMAVVSGQP